MWGKRKKRIMRKIKKIERGSKTNLVKKSEDVTRENNGDGEG